MLEKFNDLHWFARFFLMMLVAAGIWYGFDYFLLSSTRAETLELRTKLSGLKSSNAEAAIVESHLPEYKAQFEQLKGQYDQAKELLPENVELSKVLESLQVTARNNNLLVVNFSPAGNDKADVQKEFYRMKPVNVRLIGNYANLEKFFLQISDLKRVVPKAGMLKELEDELSKNFSITDNGRVLKQYQDALRFESYVPESLNRLELGTP